VFLLSHMLPARPRMRLFLVALLGRRGHLAAYSLVSVLVLAWLIAATGRAPRAPVWSPAAWQAWVPAVVVPMACVLLALGLGIPNPFSIGGAHPERFDPTRAGVLVLTRHPVLAAIALWAAAHVPPNGDLATAALFAAFAAMGIVGMHALDRRRRDSWGEETWRRMTRGTGSWRADAASLMSRAAGVRVAAGLAAWLLLLFLHPIVLGVSPLPRVNLSVLSPERTSWCMQLASPVQCGAVQAGSASTPMPSPLPGDGSGSDGQAGYWLG
jgi:uncharacterized membrane protein